MTKPLANKARHLIRTSDFSTQEILDIFQKALHYKSLIPTQTPTHFPLKNKKVITIFFENSTRTLSSFELAVKNLGGEILRLDVSRSSTAKGETISDTAANLNAMNPNAIIIRHKNAGAGYYLSSKVNCPILNGGDGAHSHPTQALLDLLTIIEHFCFDSKNLHSQNAGADSADSADFKGGISNCLEILKGKKIAIVGDIINSRVANSNIELLSRFGMEVILVAPPHFLPSTSLRVSDDLKAIAKEVDVIMSLRTQTERHNQVIYGSLKDYAHKFCVSKEILGDNKCIVLHPGPVHRNIDIDDEVLKDPRSKVLEQVTNGVCVRMAVLDFLIR
ncbi:aspartate carbamoyltransferase [Helicobacter sp. MIT 00-7814]|uniref:aspartate carbamoyltransferase catalytic subunit n=1 Tax=unclassified Helicobacter TaxID=2593540 RepID=UPI000E1FB151|nr:MULTISPECIES: aspartate carbamoyltransferase catalytic subunit [unclassified Helicobacter]RDU53668.1 aspartate carbamoyltransferase [Helicobacter sp. MIT 00-7814]RDU54040.1 aspartate carbamoyltransferase [Helicobacter sp. MIT 99-10781]